MGPAPRAAPDRASSWGSLGDAAGARGIRDSAGWGPSVGARRRFQLRAWLGWREPPSMDFLQIWYYPHLSLRDTHTTLSLSLSLSVCVRVQFTPVNPNTKLNQSSSRCQISDSSSRWSPHQFHTATVLPATAVPLPWIQLWLWLELECCLLRDLSRSGRWTPGMSSSGT